MTPKWGGTPASLPASLIVFDMDGVLVDVRASFRVAIARTVEALGGGVATPGEIAGLKAEGGYNNDWDLSRELLRRRGREVPLAQVIEVFNRFYLGPKLDGCGGLIQEETWLLPLPLLTALGERHRLAIFTGRPRADAFYTLRHFGVEAAFADLVALEDVPRQKPDPAGLLDLARRHAPLPLAAYVGDTVDDARCAAAAGVAFHAIAADAAADGPHFQALGCERIWPGVAAIVQSLLA